MKNSTLLRSLICLFILSFFSVPDAKAQIEVGVCFYENDCIFAEFVAVQEESPTSTNLVIVLNAILGQGGPCNNIDGLIFAPVGGLPVRLSRAALEADPFVELTVNRALFTATPDVLISTFFIQKDEYEEKHRWTDWRSSGWGKSRSSPGSSCWNRDAC